MIPGRRSLALAVIMLFAIACTRNSVDSQSDYNPDNEGVSTDDAEETQDTVITARAQQGGRDSDFVLAAADGGMLEVRLGELAMKQGSSEDIKSFAKTMTIDHGKANDELKNIASKLNISVPKDLSEKSQQKYNDLAQKEGAEFDKAYSQMMVTEHQETIEKFQTEAKNGERTEIKNWAEAKIPTLEHHLEMAEKMNSGESPQGR